jgi:SMC interacting uncharacterized protein involved in chromosome segregation
MELVRSMEFVPRVELVDPEVRSRLDEISSRLSQMGATLSAVESRVDRRQAPFQNDFGVLTDNQLQQMELKVKGLITDLAQTARERNNQNVERIEFQLTELNNQLCSASRRLQDTVVTALDRVAAQQAELTSALAKIEAELSSKASPLLEVASLGTNIANLGTNLANVFTTSRLKKEVRQGTRTVEGRLDEISQRLQALEQLLVNASRDPDHSLVSVVADSQDGHVDETLAVIVSSRGEKYHREHCRYLGKIRKTLPLAEAMQRYTACSACAPRQ